MTDKERMIIWLKTGKCPGCKNRTEIRTSVTSPHTHIESGCAWIDVQYICSACETEWFVEYEAIEFSLPKNWGVPVDFKVVRKKDILPKRHYILKDKENRVEL